jgi:N-acetylglutamate synthase-like GNAT family acetyltransferase
VIHLRIASAADERAVSALLAKAYSALMRSAYDPDVIASALPVITRANPSLLTSGTYYLGTLDGEIVGCGGWTRERPGTGEIVPGLAHIRHFATDPRHCRRGIGKLIYSKCEHHARSAGVQRFECYASLNAAPFYAALGFRTVRHMSLPLVQSLEVPCQVMARTIDRMDFRPT